MGLSFLFDVDGLTDERQRTGLILFSGEIWVRTTRQWKVAAAENMNCIFNCQILRFSGMENTAVWEVRNQLGLHRAHRPVCPGRWKMKSSLLEKQRTASFSQCAPPVWNMNLWVIHIYLLHCTEYKTVQLYLSGLNCTDSSHKPHCRTQSCYEHTETNVKSNTRASSLIHDKIHQTSWLDICSLLSSMIYVCSSWN